VGPNISIQQPGDKFWEFQSSVRINVGPNSITGKSTQGKGMFQSSVRINVGPNAGPDGERVAFFRRFNPP